MNFFLFISCPKGLEYLLEQEVRAIGLNVTRVSHQGVYGEGNLTIAYNLCLWSRLANRVQVILFNGQAHNQQTLYQLCHQYAWQTVFAPEKSFAVEFHGSSPQIRNTMFGAQVVKDAIVDHFRNDHGLRPNVTRDNPDIRLHAYLHHDDLTVSLDLSGFSLHQRGYRLQAGKAPIKENIAAAMLYRADWPRLAAEGYSFYDPFCGSGTLVIEAAMMAGHIAPGLLRDDHSLQHWVQHQPTLWDKQRALALQQVKPTHAWFGGSDEDSNIIDIAKENAARAGVNNLVHFSARSLSQGKPPAGVTNGLILSNPPYGERLGEVTQLIPLYQQIGQMLHGCFQGWKAGILSNNPLLAKAIGLRSTKQYALFNGPMECKLYCIELDEANRLKSADSVPSSPGGTMFANRLQKNLSHLKKWASRNQISCYRVYDADLPEYAFAIDCYNEYAVLQEYAAPAEIPTYKTEKRSLEVIHAVPHVLGIPPSQVIVKTRKPQKGVNQYEKMDKTHHRMIVREGNAQFYVNLYDYLDTGLFLDHRLLRLNFATLTSGTRFLNCFCYTATASAHAALAGAITTSVDLSQTYLNWAEENFKLNDINPAKHQFIQFDCIEWLKRAKDRFDVIFLDPPSFSNSKRMESTLDIQRDHTSLIQSAMRLLFPGGKLYFSTNLRSFKLDPSIPELFTVKDITTETIDVDFKRDQRIHRCYLITK